MLVKWFCIYSIPKPSIYELLWLFEATKSQFEHLVINRIMKQALLLLLVPLLFISCEKEYDLSQRLTLETKVVNSENQALENISIEVYTGASDPEPYFLGESKFFFGSGRDYGDLITYNETNSSGDALMHFPVRQKSNDSTTVNFRVEFKDNEHYELNIIVEKDDFINNHLLLSPVKLFQDSNLVILDIEDQTTDFELVDYYIEGDVLYRVITSANFENPIKFRTPRSFRVKKDQTIFLNYTLTDPTTETEFNERIPINIENTDVDYAIQNPE